MAASGSTKPGYAVFIVNKEPLIEGFARRNHCEKDAENLRYVFTNTFGFTELKLHERHLGGSSPSYCDNMKRLEFLHDDSKSSCGPKTEPCVICKIRQTDHGDSECFVLAISSHGDIVNGDSVVRFCDGEYVTVQKILDNLNDENCPNLKGKQRILIINVCRTLPSKEGEDDPGVKVVVDNAKQPRVNPGQQPTSSDGGVLGKITGTDIRPEAFEPEDEDDEVENVPISELSLKLPAGFLVVFPVTKGRASNRNSKGSWMIQALKHVADGIRTEDVNFLQFLTLVGGHVAREMETHVAVVEGLNEQGRPIYATDDKGIFIWDDSKSFMKSTVELRFTISKPIVFKRKPNIEAERPNLL